eukprot:Phypoly_transcript_09678.p1 GENE.Phypoly_transcript_09678~~Phypoly_transcript_09678.p1  ORF type:complete len:456 (+),score=19.77 Phypoly_transcript_09678:128-1369(+)
MADIELPDLTPQRCNKHNKLRHDFFISYRVSTDHINSEKLAAHLDGKQRPNGGHFSTYLDKNCLIQGKDWEVGFTYGIHHSNAILLLISQGLISTMAAKAKRNEVDNVLKEHKIAMDLMDHGRLVIPVYVASLSATKSKRDCYIKLDHNAALRQFDGEGEAPEVCERLLERRRILEQIFNLPNSVNIEPDSIAEKVPKILQLWYAEFVKKRDPKSGTCTGRKKGMTAVEPNPISSIIKYPTQSFRLIFVGALLGFFGAVFSLSLLLMHSKSKQHTDLKTGVAIGSITIFIAMIIVYSVFGVRFFYNSQKIYCSRCEVVVAGRNSSASAIEYYNRIPYIKQTNAECKAKCDSAVYESDCLNCLCGKIYSTCKWQYGVSIVMTVLICLLTLTIVGTSLLAARFTRNESFSMSLSQ